MRFLVRQALRRDWLCEDQRVRGCCSEPDGAVGGCADCPTNRLDEAMAGPLGGAIDRAFRFSRAKNAGVTLNVELTAEELLAVEIIHEERAAYLQEQDDRESEAESVKREMGKAQGVTRWRGNRS